jgi:hypothetical protein
MNEYRAVGDWNRWRKTEVLEEKACPSANLSTTNPTWTGVGLNPCLRGEMPATTRLSHITTFCCYSQGKFVRGHTTKAYRESEVKNSTHSLMLVLYRPPAALPRSEQLCLLGPTKYVIIFT